MAKLMKQFILSDEEKAWCNDPKFAPDAWEKLVGGIVQCMTDRMKLKACDVDTCEKRREALAFFSGKGIDKLIDVGGFSRLDPDAVRDRLRKLTPCVRCVSFPSKRLSDLPGDGHVAMTEC